uniref:Putative secreted protein n=1 Tax=Amblyomma triste TaxID=251400 RepID=A0A023G4W3_AMBTT
MGRSLRVPRTYIKRLFLTLTNTSLAKCNSMERRKCVYMCVVKDAVKEHVSFYIICIHTVYGQFVSPFQVESEGARYKGSDSKQNGRGIFCEVQNCEEVYNHILLDSASLQDVHIYKAKRHSRFVYSTCRHCTCNMEKHFGGRVQH